VPRKNLSAWCPAVLCKSQVGWGSNGTVLCGLFLGLPWPGRQNQFPTLTRSEESALASILHRNEISTSHLDNLKC
jgi:hypothetical protein